jgi:hypothetical protein
MLSSMSERLVFDTHRAAITALVSALARFLTG